jgi:photosynthetic reaction center H subunit
MSKGSITEHIDVALVVLYFFWAFFAYLIYYLRREDKREGYPLAYEGQANKPIFNFPSIPPPKTFVLLHGGTVEAPRFEPQAPVAAVPVAGFTGAPLEPTGNAMLDGVGPGSYALRAEKPDLTLDGLPKIVPMRLASHEKLITHATQGTEANPPPDSGKYHHFTLSPRDPDPRGMEVIGADRVVAGVVKDVWIDVSEVMIRYLEVQVAQTGTTVLLPMPFARIDKNRRRIHVNAILGSQFAQVPALRNPDEVTFREEDRITAYYGGGTLYATPARRESML